VDGLGEPGSGEPADGDVLGVDRLAVADYCQGCLVSVVEPGVPHFPVQDGDPVPGPDLVRVAFPLAGQGFLCLFEPSFRLAEEARVPDHRSV